MRDYKLSINDIIAAIDSIESFVKGMNINQLKEDDKTFSAVIQKFGVIGEAAKNVPETIKEKNPDLPWKEMGAMRNILIHAYFGIDYELVWDAIKNKIPKVKIKLKKILREIQKEE
ncbi:MAG: HepT-like ribonuclease domain-containing protein [Elusimicrobiota bacterium]